MVEQCRPVARDEVFLDVASLGVWITLAFVVGTSLVALYSLDAAAAWTVDPSPVSVVKFFRA